MSVEIIAPPIFILNGTSFRFDENISRITNLSINNNIIIDIKDESKNPYFLTGSDFFSNQATNKVMRATKESTTWNIQMYIENQGSGTILNDSITPFLNILKSVINIPCQFIGFGQSLMWGFIETWNYEINAEEKRVLFNFSIQERAEDFVLNPQTGAPEEIKKTDEAVEITPVKLPL